MSHPDPLHDYDYENEVEGYFDDDDDDWDEDDDWEDDDCDIIWDDEDEDYDDSMDGDHESALSSAGWGTDEDYGSYGDDDFGGYGCDDNQPDDWHLDDGDF